jgi:hypothetical protein
MNPALLLVCIIVSSDSADVHFKANPLYNIFCHPHKTAVHCAALLWGEKERHPTVSGLDKQHFHSVIRARDREKLREKKERE